MKDLDKHTCRIALVQAEPVLFNKQESLKKALGYIEEAARNKAELIVFPELFIPGYPVGMNFGFSVGKRTEPGREDWKRYYDASVVAGGEEFIQLASEAKKRGAYISIGFSERDAVGGTLYNSNAIFEPDGTYKVHRKLKPTGSERLVWGDADKYFFPVTETPWGPIGSLICWESYMPLARVALYQKGITIYISPNTNDNPEWQHSDRRQMLFYQFRHDNQKRVIPGGSEYQSRDSSSAGHSVPRRKLHNRPLWALRYGSGMG